MKRIIILFSLLFIFIFNCFSQLEYNIQNKGAANFQSKQGKVFNLNIMPDSGYYKRIKIKLPSGILLMNGEKVDKIKPDSNTYSIFIPNDFTYPKFIIEVQQIHYSAASRTFATIWRAGFKYPIALTLTTSCFMLDCICLVYTAYNNDDTKLYFTEQSFELWRTHRRYKDEIAIYDIALNNDSSMVTVPAPAPIDNNDLQQNDSIADDQPNILPDSIRALIKPIKPEMIRVDGGSFNMGDSLGDSNQRPVHKVTVSTFSIAKNLVTVAEFNTFCMATGRQMPDPPSWGWNDNHPIVNINYYDAIDYCKWLTDELKIKYRLPTEAEWEYAARGGNKSKGTIYAGSNDLSEVGWYNENSSGQANVIEYKTPNELGIYDMSGNVFEWCNDWFEIYKSNSNATNPTGPSTGTDRVIRGGCWDIDSSECKVTTRFSNPEEGSGDGLGFRIVAQE